MEILKLKAHNFKNYTDIDIDFKKLKGLNLIQGHNGAGKTSIIDAMCYAIYGKTSIGITGDYVVNRFIGKDTMVELTFSIGDSTYVINRYRKDSKHKNEVLLSMNDKDITLPSIKGTNAKIEEIIGVPYNIFLSSVLFNSTSVDLFINSTDKKRKELLERLLGVGIFKDALELVKEDIKEKTTKQQTVSSTLDTMKVAKEQEERLMQTYNCMVEQYKIRENNLKNQIDTLVKELPNEDELSKLEDKVVYFDNEIEKLKSEQMPFNNTNKLNSLYNDKSQLENTISNIKSKVTQGRELIKQDKQEFNNLKNSENPVCKYCGNTLDDTHKRSEMKRLYSEVQNTIESINALKTPYKNAESDLKDTMDNITKEQLKAKQYNDTRLKKQTALNEAMKQKVSWESKIDSISHKEDNIKSLQRELQEIINNPIEKPNLTFDKSAYDNLLVDKENLKQELDTLEQVKIIYGNKGIKNSYISSSIPVINNKLDEYLSILSDDTFTASITTKTTAKNGNVSNNINLVIDYPSRNGEIEFTELSSGEKRLVSLAINLAFNYYLNSNTPFNTLFLDEVLDTLSSNRIENVFKLLKSLKKDYTNILLISHVDEIKDNPEIDNVININHDNQRQANLQIK